MAFFGSWRLKSRGATFGGFLPEIVIVAIKFIFKFLVVIYLIRIFDWAPGESSLSA
jgi:hypothetical protein